MPARRSPRRSELRPAATDSCGSVRGPQPGDARRFRSRRSRRSGSSCASSPSTRSRCTTTRASTRGSPGGCSRGTATRYDPVFHGPVQFYLIGIADILIGAGEYAARLPAAVLGTVAVFLPFFLRRQLGAIATLTASVALCLSPSFLYFSRFAREDIHVATHHLALLVVLIRFFDAPRRWQPVAFFTLLAVASRRRRRPTSRSSCSASSSRDWCSRRAVQERRQSRRFLGADAIQDATSLGAGSVGLGRIGLPRPLYAPLLDLPDFAARASRRPRREHPLLALPAAGRARRAAVVLLPRPGRRPTSGRSSSSESPGSWRRPAAHASGALLLWMFVGSLAVFSWASERMPWLVLHPLLPLILLAGLGGQAVWDARRRRVRGWCWPLRLSPPSAGCTRPSALLLPRRGRS